MKRPAHFALCVALPLFFGAAANAQDWAGTPVTSSSVNGHRFLNGTNLGPITLNSQTPFFSFQLSGAESVTVLCTPGCPASGFVPEAPNQGIQVSNVGNIVLPISDFASARSLGELAQQVQQVQAMQSMFAQQEIALSHQAADFSAMAAALHGSTPLPGLTNRLGLNMATIDGRQAAAVNYVHVVRDVDLNAGFAWANGRAMGELGIGVSW